MKKGRKLPIRIGGLLACCVVTIRKQEADTEGSTVECQECHGVAVIRDGAWEWTTGKW